MRNRLWIAALCLLFPLSAWCQDNTHLFQPFTWEWPTPNAYRLGSGAPGPEYWQQQADYQISVTLDPEGKRLTGEETITYTNNSPHTLRYLWLQLDQDVRSPHSVARQLNSAYELNENRVEEEALEHNVNQGQGFQIEALTDPSGKPIAHFIGETNLRIDLAEPLKPGKQYAFRVKWNYQINDARKEGRSGYEFFTEDGAYIYEMAQFYPRMCAYDAEKGWQNRPFFGDGEFALEFGDFEVEITLPANYLVGSTGTLQNTDEVLSNSQRKRLAALGEEPGEVQYIVTPAEATKNRRSSDKGEKTWKFAAESVRDFAFAASKTFVWDAAQVEVGGKMVLAQSMYPTEGMPLWDKYATHVIIHTLKTYSKYSLDYPYPQATVIHGPVWGMEYPMISFCGGRPQRSGYYSRTAKYRMIGVIIHEVGHNFFPMIVNSDERRWAWMDEGLNSYLEYLTEREWEPNFPHRRGPADDLAFPLMLSKGRAIMTNPESIRDNGMISYGKTAAGLNLLRTLVLGPENFDFAFREYARRWAFRRPEPADFFRTIEDATGQDLDWFWRGWFYQRSSVDFALTGVRHYIVPLEEGLEKPYNVYPTYVPETVSEYYIQGRDKLKDEYTDTKEEWKARDSANEKAIAKLLEEAPRKTKEGFHLYQVEVKRKGEMVFPIPMQIIFTDGSRENYLLPAQLWIDGRTSHTHEFKTRKEAVAFQLDGLRILPEVDRSDNLCPQPRLNIGIERLDLR